MRRVVCLLLVLALPARAADAEPERSPSVLRAVLIGATGLVLAGGYTAGAFATGDRPSGFTLATVGGVVSGGLLGAGVGLGLKSLNKDPGSLLTYILVPVLTGLAGAILGGVLAGVGSNQPGTGRTVTHVLVVSLLLGETIAVELAH